MSDSRNEEDRDTPYDEASGIAARMLVESLLFALVEKSVFTQKEARDVVGNAMSRVDEETAVYAGIDDTTAKQLADSRQFLEGLMGDYELNKIKGSDQ